jgi:DNA-binding Xre family transcriptional regulator
LNGHAHVQERAKFSVQTDAAYDEHEVPKLLPHHPTRDLVAANFKRMLVERSTTIKAVAEASNVKRSVLYRIRNADTGVTIDVLGRIADALGVRVEEFFRYEALIH